MVRNHLTKQLTVKTGNLFHGLYSKPHSRISLIGICILFTFLIQIISGVMIAFSLNCDPMNIPMSRNEEDMEDLYTDDFFWLHERGVDYSFILIYAHMFRKLQIASFTKKQEGAWKTGVLLLLLLHVVTFLGLVLCCTHLSEVTLTIAANMLHSAVLKYGKIYWWIFPNQELNVDTVTRLMYAHYLSALFLFAAAVYHSLEMHRDWKDSVFDESQKHELAWFDDVFKNELVVFCQVLFIVSGSSLFLYDLSEPSSTELFMWGDVGSVSEIRFYGVTPHWYFRAYMAWLIVCPHHYLGLGGLVFFLVSLYYQPNIKNLVKSTGSLVFWTESPTVVAMNITLLLSVLYGVSYLPYGKFFNRLGGNPMSLLSFSFVLIYLSAPIYIWLYSLNWKFHKVSRNTRVVWNFM